MTSEKRAELIAKYKAGDAEVTGALKDISNEELDFRCAKGKWTNREIVHHLGDSEMTAAIRFRKLLTESNPYIQGYDQDQFARMLRYKDRPIEGALAAFRAARATTAEIIERMSAPDWERAGEHSESGPYSLDTWLEIYSAHAHNHAEQIRRNRTTYRERNPGR